jgi:hypothetical protein
MMMPGPGDPPKNDATTLDEVVVTASPQGPVIIDNPIYSNLMEQYTAGLPKGGTYNNQTWSGTSVRDADLTRKLTDEELANWTKYHQNKLRQNINSLKAQGQDYSEQLAQYNFIPKGMYVPAIPEGMGADYYSKPENWYFNTRSLGENYPKPSQQIEDIFANTPTPTPATPQKNLQFVQTGAITYPNDFRAMDWGMDPATGEPSALFRLFNPLIPGQENTNVQFTLPRADDYYGLQSALYGEQKAAEMQAMNAFNENVLNGEYDYDYENSPSQTLRDKYNEYINNPEWVNSLSEQDKAKYIAQDYSNIPLYANTKGEETYVPLRTGMNTWKYKGQEYNYDPTLTATDKSYKIPLTEPYTDSRGNTYNELYQYNNKIHLNDPTVPLKFRKGGPMRLNTMYSPDLTYAAKMGGYMYGYGGRINNPLMSLPTDNFVRYAKGGMLDAPKLNTTTPIIVQGAGTDTYQYKYENGNYYTAKKGTADWKKVEPTNKTAYTAVKTLIDNYKPEVGGPGGGSQYDLMMSNIAAEESGEIVPPTIAEVEANRAIADAQEKMQNAETSEEYQEGVKEYEYGVRTAEEALKDKNLKLSMAQSIGSGLAMAAPAAYNLTTGLFGKPEQLDYKNYEIAADITPYEYNINPQLAMANQTFAQAQEAARNASNAGNYLSNMQGLANLRNQTVGELYTNKENLDAAQIQAAKTANKQIETDNLTRRLEVEDFNRLSKAQKQEALKAGLVQMADIGKNMEEKKMQLALIKAMAPDFANTLSYSTIGEQLLEYLKNQKAAGNTSAESEILKTK